MTQKRAFVLAFLKFSLFGIILPVQIIMTRAVGIGSRISEKSSAW